MTKKSKKFSQKNGFANNKDIVKIWKKSSKMNKKLSNNKKTFQTYLLILTKQIQYSHKMKYHKI